MSVLIAFSFEAVGTPQHVRLLEAIGVPYTGSAPAACMRCTDKVLAKHLMREAAIPTPDFHSFREASIKELGAADAIDDVEGALGFPLVVKPARQGSALGVKFARTSEELPAALVGAFSYDRKILVERYVKGRDLAVSVLDGHPHTLSFLAAINATPIAALGVQDFGQSGDVEDLYEYYGIDAETIVGAALDLI